MVEPLVTIAIACRDEEARIEALVRAAQSQDWPRERLQIVVADGMSMDATREVLARLATEDPRIELADNPARGRPAGLNECIRRARGEFVVRLDAGAEYPAEFVRRCVTALTRTGADTVDGTAHPKGESFWQRCVAAALRSPLGVRRSKPTRESDEGWADGVRPGAFRRDIFERAGLYDPRSAADEDAELRRRIAATGGSIEHVEALDADFVPRDSLQALIRRSFGYGQGRARTMLKHGPFSSWGPAMPLLWLLGEAALAAASPKRAFPWSLAVYALATGAEAVRVGFREGPLSVPVVWAIFPALHLAHGVGFASGLARYAAKPDWHDSGPLESIAPPPHAARNATA